MNFDKKFKSNFLHVRMIILIDTILNLPRHMKHRMIIQIINWKYTPDEHESSRRHPKSPSHHLAPPSEVKIDRKSIGRLTSEHD